MTAQADERQVERLLEQIRVRVAELHGVERSRADRFELRRRRREITELQWQLARFVSHEPSGGNLAA